MHEATRSLEAGTLILSRERIAASTCPLDYIRALESAFCALDRGDLLSLPVGHIPGDGGAFHIKAARSRGEHGRAVIKINGNFPNNPMVSDLPTIQGCLLLTDAHDGRLLAMMDSIEITAQRTAAASAIAARHLARRDSRTLALIGCGLQARYQLDAVLALGRFPLQQVRLYDQALERCEPLRVHALRRGLAVDVMNTAASACKDADIVITTTTATAPLLGPQDVRPGTFIAAVGADNPSKCEIAPALMARSRVVPDLLVQAVAMGDLRSAIECGALRAESIHAELAAIVAGKQPGRRDDDEMFIFDSTGLAIEDLAAAEMVYERARHDPSVLRIGLNTAPVLSLERRATEIPSPC